VKLFYSNVSLFNRFSFALLSDSFSQVFAFALGAGAWAFPREVALEVEDRTVKLGCAPQTKF